MNRRPSRPVIRAFTLVDLLTVIAALLILSAAFVMFVLPNLARPHHVRDSYCANNLKEVGLAFRVWQGDHNDRYPMRVPITNGGAMEFVGGSSTFRCFEVMSNELNTPRILFCPVESDRFRTQAVIWGTGTSMQLGFSGNSNVSYFVGIDALDIYPQMFLSGDHNIENGVAPKGGILELNTNRPAHWTTQMHQHGGNVLLADGSVQSLNTPALRKALEQTGTNNNRLAMP